MTDEQQPASPRPGPYLFGARPAAVRPVPGAPGPATQDGPSAGAERDRDAATGAGSPAHPDAGPEPAGPDPAGPDPAGPDPAGPGTPEPARVAAGGLDPTGEPRVDEALSVLDELTGRPTGDQVAGYEQAHRSLQDVLATVDDA